MSEREELARLIDPAAFLPIDDNPTARDDQPAWQSKAFHLADRILAAGYHRGPRLPAPDTPEWDAMVERAAEAGYDNMDEPPDTAWTWLYTERDVAVAERDAAVERAERAEGALVPFADVSGEGDEDFADDTPVVVKFGRTTHYALTLGDFRRAAAIAADEAQHER